MNINPNFENEFNFDSDDSPPADTLMLLAMAFINEKLIEPMEDKLSEQDQHMLSLIGVAFHGIGQQARAMEELEAHLNKDQNQNFSQN